MQKEDCLKIFLICGYTKLFETCELSHTFKNLRIIADASVNLTEFLQRVSKPFEEHLIDHQAFGTHRFAKNNFVITNGNCQVPRFEWQLVSQELRKSKSTNGKVIGKRDERLQSV